MHEHLTVDLKYGCGKYDYQSGGTVICVAPGQIGGKEDNGERINLDGWALLFHPDMLQRFSSVLEDYYAKGEQFRQGLPSVAYCADRLCMSAGYFGDMVKKHTGDSAKNYIHHFIIQKAKNLLASGEAISAAAYDLGFDYPQHLSRLFKKKEGISPSEYIDKIKHR